MSVSVPQPFSTSVSVAQPFRTRVEGIPSGFTVGVTDVAQVPVSLTVEKIPTLHLSIDEIPPVHVSVDALPPIHVSVDKLPPINVELAPVEIRLTEVPSTRVHIPADFAVSLSMMGMDFGSIRLCGEAQVITEPYRPNPCEICSRSTAVDPIGPIRPVDPVRPSPAPVDPVPSNPTRPN